MLSQIMESGNHFQQIFVSFSESPEVKAPLVIVSGESRPIQEEVSNFVFGGNLLNLSKSQFFISKMCKYVACW